MCQTQLSNGSPFQELLGHRMLPFFYKKPLGYGNVIIHDCNQYGGCISSHFVELLTYLWIKVH